LHGFVSRSIRACAVDARPIQDRSHDRIMIAIMDADGLRAGDWVLIDGMLAPNWRHVIAGDIWRDDKRGAWSKRLDRRTCAKRDKGSPRGVERPRILRASGRGRIPAGAPHGVCSIGHMTGTANAGS
jgi:hypothetical protein